MTLYLSLLPKSFKREIRFINIQQDTLTFTGTERTMDTRELICVCVCVERDALFMQEIVKLSQPVIRGEWHCWDHFKGEPGCKVLLNFSPY